MRLQALVNRRSTASPATGAAGNGYQDAPPAA
jgi:hypothetical protein